MGSARRAEARETIHTANAAAAAIGLLGKGGSAHFERYIRDLQRD